MISKFANYKANISNGSVDLWEWLLGDNEYRGVVDMIRQMPDKVQRNKYKAMLPAVTISGIFSHRGTDCLISHTGLICIDIDGNDNPNITDWEVLKPRLAELSYILYCGLSVSATGVFCIVEIADSEKHLNHFYALRRDFQAMGIVIDSSCKDICRLRGYSYDAKAYLNINAVVYDKFADSPMLVPRKLPYPEKRRPIDVRAQLLQPSIGKAVVVSPSENIYPRIRNLIANVIHKEIDITVRAEDWFIICAILARLFLEEGRAMFHNVSKFYPNYTKKECDATFTRCLLRSYSYSAEQLFEIARKYGVY